MEQKKGTEWPPHVFPRSPEWLQITPERACNFGCETGCQLAVSHDINQAVGRSRLGDVGARCWTELWSS